MSKSAPQQDDDEDSSEGEFTPAEEIIEEHRSVFETIARRADDPDFREKYGARPLRYLEQEGDGS